MKRILAAHFGMIPWNFAADRALIFDLGRGISFVSQAGMTSLRVLSELELPSVC
ncbi:hypothetical protein H8A99_11405 [Bradyrhizobium sp. Arg68]|uniref:hypothetical protein n=1 Tax=Bradyrhizobium ivorense TaxID=2511166 RepID=UPI001E494ECA|nr:hypothetical protein [Bradyrhizobium ivorense]MCC8937074.1 hypothetical protein [Bradyrhizobium ivorense]